MTIDLYRQAGADLNEKLHLPTFPVAVKYIRSEEEIPEAFIRPTAMCQKWSLCQAFTYARRWGWHTAMTEIDNFCVPAAAMHQWIDVTAEEFIESQVRQGWHLDEVAEWNRYRYSRTIYQGEGGEERLAKARAHCGFICSPLPRTTIEPDTILIFGNGAHIMHLVHAACYRYQEPVISSFEGFGESCIKGGLLPFITGQPQIVIPGMGDRAFGGISESEIAIGLPATLLLRIVEDLFKTGGDMNVGQPLKALLPSGLTESITPGFQFLRDIVERKKEKGKTNKGRDEKGF